MPKPAPPDLVVAKAAPGGPVIAPAAKLQARPAARDIHEKHQYMDTDDFDRAATKADRGERFDERDLIFLLPPDRVLHREVKGNTTAFIKGLPFDAGESLMLDVFGSFEGTAVSQQCGSDMVNSS